MGLLNLEVQTLDNGIQISNTYVYIKDMKIENSGHEYNVFCSTEEYASREVRDEGRPKLKGVMVNYSVETLPDTLPELWKMSYEEVKKCYSNSTEV